MKVIDPGHVYELAHLDGQHVERLVFVKREGDGYPGNFGHHEGTNLQEVLRALIDRVEYLNRHECRDRRHARCEVSHFRGPDGWRSRMKTLNFLKALNV